MKSIVASYFGVVLVSTFLLGGCAADKASSALDRVPSTETDADGGGSLTDAGVSDGSDAETPDTADTSPDSGDVADGTDATEPTDADAADADAADAGAADGTADADALDGTTDADGNDGADAGDVADGSDSHDTAPPVPCPDGQYPATFGNELTLDGSWLPGQLGDCTPYAHVAIGARESTYRLEILRLPKDARVDVYTPHYFSTESPAETLTPLASLEPGSSTLIKELSFSPEFSGEVVIEVSRPDSEEHANYEIRMVCESRCDKIATRFPLILLHGLFGTNNYLGILDYWYGIEPEYDRLGIEYRVSVSGLIRNSEGRAKIIAPYIEDVLAETGARKVNLLGHSQGGLDARIVSSANGEGLGDRIASITTLATPHHGVPIDLAGLLVLFGAQDFTVANARAFNQKYIDYPGIDYYSWGGRTCSAFEFRCLLETGGELVDPLVSVFYGLIKAQGYENDGLVTVQSAHWGTYLGTVPADHLDEIGQIADPRNDLEPFDHVQFFIDEVYRLIDGGY